MDGNGQFLSENYFIINLHSDTQRYAVHGVGLQYDNRLKTYYLSFPEHINPDLFMPLKSGKS